MSKHTRRYIENDTLSELNRPEMRELLTTQLFGVGEEESAMSNVGKEIP